MLICKKCVICESLQIQKFLIKISNRLKTLYFKTLKYGPGRIRTYDQGIMSPLRYRCATSPCFYFCLLSSAIAALPTSHKMIFNHFVRQSATSPCFYFCLLSSAVAMLHLSSKETPFLSPWQSATSLFALINVS